MISASRANGRRRPVSPIAAVALAVILVAPALRAQNDDALVAKARAIHAKVIKIDTHVDFSPNVMTDSTPNYVTGLGSQVDLPKMRNGGVNGVNAGKPLY